MTTTRTHSVNLPAAWVAAIREDAMSPFGDIARREAGLTEKILTPHRVVIRVGTWYPDHPASARSAYRPSIAYLKSPPTCQACGERIANAQHAVKFRFRPRGHGWGRERYIHEHCPREATT